MAGGGGAATARTPAPRSVRMDRLVLGSLAVAVLGGFAFQAMLKERETRDWSVVHQDSIALQGLEGIVMGFRGSEVSLRTLLLLYAACSRDAAYSPVQWH